MFVNKLIYCTAVVLVLVITVHHLANTERASCVDLLVQHKTWTADYGLGIKHGLSISD